MAYTRTMNGKVPQVLQELHFDETPTPGSLNPVTSGGVDEAVAEAVDAAKEEMQGKIDEVTLDPSAVALGNVHNLDEVTSFAADAKILVDSETDGPGAMTAEDLLELSAQNALAGNVAPAFNENETYLPKKSVVVDGKAVTFVTNHSAGAFSTGEVVDWNPDHENTEYVLSKGHYYINTGAVSEGDAVSFSPSYSSAANLKYAVIDATGINFISFNAAVGGDASRLWAFVDNSGNLIKVAESSSSAYSGLVIVPSSAKTIIINIREGSFELVRSDSVEKIGHYLNIPSTVDSYANWETSSNAGYRVMVKKVSPGDVLKVEARGGSSAWPVSFFDSSMKLLVKCATISSGSDVLTGGAVFCAPLQAAYIVINSKDCLDEKVTYNEFSVDCVKCVMSNPVKFYWPNETVGNSVNINKPTSGSNPRVMAVIDVEGLSNVFCYGEGGVSARLWSFLDSSFEIISSSASDARNTYTLIPVPSGAKYFIMQSSYSGICFGLPSDRIPNLVYDELKKLDAESAQKLESLVDSNGYITSNYVFTNYSNHGLCTLISFMAEQDESVSENVDFIYVFNGVTSRFSLSKCKGKKRFYSFRVPPANMDQLLRIGFYAASDKKLKISAMSITYATGSCVSHKGIRMDAHLGLQALAPENTMVAFDLASKCGFEGCVANPINSADGTFYCYHEDDATLTIDGTTAVSLSSSAFRALTDAQLASYKVFGLSGQRTKYMEKIPTLYEFFELCAITGMKPVLSTHPAPTVEQLGEIKAMTDKLGITDALTIKAFSLTVLENAFEVFGHIDGYVFDLNSVSDIGDIIAEVKATNFFAAGEKVTIEIVYSALTREIAEAVIAEGIALGTWDMQIANYPTAIEYGVTRFTEKGHNSCNGLSWR